MTKQEKLEMFSMRLDGCTFAEIGRRFNVSRQYVEQTLRGTPRKKSQSNSEKCIYKGLSNYISSEGMTLCQLAEIVGLSSTGTTTIRKKITGRRKFNITEIKKILELTGLSFEECFCEKDVENGNKK